MQSDLSYSHAVRGILAIAALALLFVFAPSERSSPALSGFGPWGPPPHVHAQASSAGQFYGHAWSGGSDPTPGSGDMGVGWISFNGSCGSGCTYGVFVAEDGLLSGYAWSGGANTNPPAQDPTDRGVGWISFNSGVPDDLAGCPAGYGPCEARLVDGELQGWARACSGAIDAENCTGGDRTDGWDGWIRLDGSCGSGCTYGPVIPGGLNQTGAFDGYVWGGDVLGWISFNCEQGGASGASVCATSNYHTGVLFGSGTILQDAFVRIIADNAIVLVGGSVIISWQSVGVGNCSVTSPWGTLESTAGAANGEQAVEIPEVGEHAFTITCTVLDEDELPTGPVISDSVVVSGREIPDYKEL